MSDLDALRELLAGRAVDAAARDAARGAIDPQTPDSITYFGSRVEGELGRLTDGLARASGSGVVTAATAALEQMLVRLRSLEPAPRRGWIARLLPRRGAGLDEDRLGVIEGELDQLAGELEACSNPLLTERLTLERRREALEGTRDAVAAHLAGGLDALAALPAGGARRDLAGRLSELALGYTLAEQGLGTLELMVETRRTLAERCEFVLRHALPLWHRQSELVRAELERSRRNAAALLAEANAELAGALGGVGPEP